MTKEITYASDLHKLLIDNYLGTIGVIVEEVATPEQFLQFTEQLDKIVDYHNGVDKADYYSWLMILPITTSLLVSGLFIGIENDENRADLRGYNVILDGELNNLVEVLSEITKENE
ncbi:hypothetical protein [uncultured Mediterranean phage uvMED]|nr:hypothetical protein [uncultured Mediterranean phage uvMED]